MSRVWKEWSFLFLSKPLLRSGTVGQLRYHYNHIITAFWYSGTASWSLQPHHYCVLVQWDSFVIITATSLLRSGTVGQLRYHYSHIITVFWYVGQLRYHYSLIITTGVCNCLSDPYGRLIMDGTKGTSRKVAYLWTLSSLTNYVLDLGLYPSYINNNTSLRSFRNISWHE